ncbi:unnamed protein product [Cuscuta epithymum]|uniref:Transmembrane protein n=1 Tax=Cuscuta epithymum TaxID=186058 RepID=A0AAV0F987_9ASTE|nr:unnamed protein product [Cuscuta epithymum]
MVKSNHHHSLLFMLPLIFLLQGAAVVVSSGLGADDGEVLSGTTPPSPPARFPASPFHPGLLNVVISPDHSPLTAHSVALPPSAAAVSTRRLSQSKTDSNRKRKLSKKMKSKKKTKKIRKIIIIITVLVIIAVIIAAVIIAVIYLKKRKESVDALPTSIA